MAAGQGRSRAWWAGVAVAALAWTRLLVQETGLALWGLYWYQLASHRACACWRDGARATRRLSGVSYGLSCWQRMWFRWAGAGTWRTTTKGVGMNWGLSNCGSAVDAGAQGRYHYHYHYRPLVGSRPRFRRHEAGRGIVRQQHRADGGTRPGARRRRGRGRGRYRRSWGPW